MSSLVVELCGLPGAGKTTVARGLSAVLERQGVPVSVADRRISAAAPRSLRVARRTVGSARAVLSHPQWALGVTRDIGSVSQPSWRDTASVLAQWLAVCDLTSHARRSGGVILLEEGLVQTAWTLRLRSADLPSPRLWDSVPTRSRSDVVLLLDVPVATVAARLAHRSSRHSRTQRLEAGALRAELEHGRRLLEELVAALAAPAVRLTAGAPPSSADLVAEAARLLRPHLATV